MSVNLFDYFEQPHGSEETPAPWAARAPRRPQRDYDVKLLPRSPRWREDTNSLAVLERLEHESWVHEVIYRRNEIRLRLSADWIEANGAALEAGGRAEAPLDDLAQARLSVQFWDPNATKALHIGHLRNLAIGNALASALTQAGARVERRSLICDVGRAMGEAMAGVMRSQGHPPRDRSLKSDHFVGICYAGYVAASGAPGAGDFEQAEDSLSREVLVHNDAADELIKRVLAGEREALELWHKTRAWAIGGQRQTLARLGISFDRVFFESDFLGEASRLTDTGLRGGTFGLGEDGVVVYETGLEDLEELPLVRADGLPTQHMRAASYCMNAPELGDITSLQVCGSEWVSHTACLEKLAAELRPELNGDFHPKHTIFHGMVAQQKRAVTSSAGALLIDELTDWIDEQIDRDKIRRRVRESHPRPERVAAQITLGYFLAQPVSPRVDFDPEKLLCEQESLGWDLVRARARSGRRGASGPLLEDPDYRFAIVQSELYRRHLRLAARRFDVRPLAQYLKHLAIWYLERERSSHVERVVHTLLDRGARGLGLGTIG